MKVFMFPCSHECLGLMFPCSPTRNSHYCSLFCSILFYSILFYSVLFCSILFYSILFYSILFYSVLFCSILFYSILFYSVLFCSVLPHSVINRLRAVSFFSWTVEQNARDTQMSMRVTEGARRSRLCALLLLNQKKK